MPEVVFISNSFLPPTKKKLKKIIIKKKKKTNTVNKNKNEFKKKKTKPILQIIKATKKKSNPLLQLCVHGDWKKILYESERRKKNNQKKKKSQREPEIERVQKKNKKFAFSLHNNVPELCNYLPVM